MAVSVTISVLLLLGFILHHVSHPAHEDASSSDHVVHPESHHMQPTFSPALWLYFVPAHVASSLPSLPLCLVFSAFVESSAAIALACMLVIGVVGHRIEKMFAQQSGGGDTSRKSAPSSGSTNSLSLVSCAQFFALSHAVFILTSFLVAVTSAALLSSSSSSSSSSPHQQQHDREGDVRTRIGQAFFGPLALATAVAVLGWSLDPHAFVFPSLFGGVGHSPPSPFASMSRSSGEGAFASSSGGALLSDLERKLTQSRFVPFHLLCLALIHDIFFSDVPPTTSEMLLGQATRGPLFPGVLAAFLSTWFYLRYVMQMPSSPSPSSPSLSAAASAAKTTIADRGNADASFSLHMCCPIDAVADSIILPITTAFSSSSALKLLCVMACCVSSATLERIDTRWSEAKASLLFLDDENNNGNEVKNNFLQQQQQQQQYYSVINIPTAAAASDASVGGAVASSSVFPLPPLPGTSDADAERRRELAMAALQQRLDAKTRSSQQQQQQSDSALHSLVP